LKDAPFTTNRETRKEETGKSTAHLEGTVRLVVARECSSRLPPVEAGTRRTRKASQAERWNFGFELRGQPEEKKKFLEKHSCMEIMEVKRGDVLGRNSQGKKGKRE